MLDDVVGGGPGMDEIFGSPEPSITIEMDKLPTRKPETFGMGMPGLPEPLQKIRQSILGAMGGAGPSEGPTFF